MKKIKRIFARFLFRPVKQLGDNSPLRVQVINDTRGALHTSLGITDKRATEIGKLMESGFENIREDGGGWHHFMELTGQLTHANELYFFAFLCGGRYEQVESENANPFAQLMNRLRKMRGE